MSIRREEQDVQCAAFVVMFCAPRQSSPALLCMRAKVKCVAAAVAQSYNPLDLCNGVWREMSAEATKEDVLLVARKFSVVRRVIRKNGKDSTREIIVHPGAVVILPILDERWIVMIRNFRVAAQEELWELPAGTLEQGESAIQTARRELEEETGYRAGHFVPMGTFHTSPGVMTELMHTFIATELSLGAQHLDEEEQIAVEVIELEHARRMLVNLELRDAKTIAALGIYFLQNTQP